MLKKYVLKAVRILAWIICYIIPIKSNKILVSNYYGKGYGDNPKYITEALLASNYNLDIVWVLNEDAYVSGLPKNVRYVRKDTISHIYELTTSKIWIDNCRTSVWYKKKGQYYIQTWHGFALKRIEKDVETNLSKDYVRQAVRDSKRIDLIVSDSKHMTDIYKKSFWYDGPIKELGSPRADLIINSSINSDAVKSKIGIPSNFGVVLYAPTFRRDKSLKAYLFDFSGVLDACKERFGRDFVILYRLHPNISNLAKHLDFCNMVYDVSDFPDMQELLIMSDVLITDYSSVMFDFMLSYRPVFLYASDFELYNYDRSFYIDYYELPFNTAFNESELVSCITSFNPETQRIAINSFIEKYGIITDGLASARCAAEIIKLIDN